MHAPGAVLRSYRLRDASLSVDLQPAQAGQQITDLAMNEVTAVQLGRDVDGQPQTPPRGLYAASVWHGANEIASQAHKRLDGSGQHALASAHRGESLLAWRLKTVQFFQLIEGRQLRFLGNPNRPLALDVGVSPHRADAGPRLTYVASQKQQVGQHLYRLDTIAMLCQPHSVHGNHRFGA